MNSDKCHLSELDMSDVELDLEWKSLTADIREAEFPPYLLRIVDSEDEWKVSIWDGKKCLARGGSSILFIAYKEAELKLQQILDRRFSQW